MRTADLMRRLGLSPTDRAVVFHVDDVGMCDATIAAYLDIAGSPVVSAASAMVPCSWFPRLARSCQDAGPERDIGVHLTLNSEWDGYRWRPLTPAGLDMLVDDDGYLPRSAAELHHRDGVQDAVYVELKAQIEQAFRLGVDVTHVDSHMLTLFSAGLIDTYVRLSREFRLPAALLRMTAPEIQRMCLVSADDAAAIHRAVTDADDLVAFERWIEMPLGDTDGNGRIGTASRLLDSAPVGLSYFVMHPAVPTAELKAIAPDWRARAADYELCLDDTWFNVVERSGVRVVGMRAVRAALFGDGPGGSG